MAGTRKNVADLNSEITTRLADNITEQISPQDVRVVNENIVASFVNWLDHRKYLGTQDYQAANRDYKQGEGAFYNGATWKANIDIAAPAGAFNATNWTKVGEVADNAIPPYAAGVYDPGAIVRFVNKIYYMNELTALNSTDFVAELIADKWTPLPYDELIYFTFAPTSGTINVLLNNYPGGIIALQLNGNTTLVLQNMRSFSEYRFFIQNTTGGNITVTLPANTLNADTASVVASFVLPAAAGYYMLEWSRIGSPFTVLRLPKTLYDSLVSNAAYDASWATETVKSASKAALYTKFEAVIDALDSGLADKVSIADLRNNLTTATAGFALDARQGAALLTLINNIINDAAILPTSTFSSEKITDLFDAAVQGIKWKEHVKCVFTSNVTLSFSRTTDGVTTGDGDRVLVAGQTDAKENGLYITDGSEDWFRAPDGNPGDELFGMVVQVLQGTSNAGTLWRCSNTSSPVIGTDNITFIAISSAIQPDASEATKGIARLSSQAEAEDAANNATIGSIDHTKIITGRGWRWAWERAKTLAQTFTAQLTFTLSPIFSSLTASQYIKTDADKKLVSLASIPGADVSDVFRVLGNTNCSSNPNYPAAKKGDRYRVSVAGKIGGASGKDVIVNQEYYALADNAGGDEAAVGSSWVVSAAGGSSNALVLGGQTFSANTNVGGSSGDFSLGVITNNREVVRFLSDANTRVNYLTFASAPTTQAATIGVDGSDTNIGLIITTKGTGTIRFQNFGSNSTTLQLYDNFSSANAFRTALIAGAGSNVLSVASGFTNLTLGCNNINLGSGGAGLNLNALTNSLQILTTTSVGLGFLFAVSPQSTLGAINADVIRYSVGITAASGTSITNLVRTNAIINLTNTNVSTVNLNIANPTITNTVAGNTIRAYSFSPIITNNLGLLIAYHSDMNLGTNRWNLNLEGTALNHINGNIGVGLTSGLNAWLNIAGQTNKAQINLAVCGGLSGTINDGDIWREDNTISGIRIRQGGVTYKVKLEI